ncbi:MAG: hypothetical protein IPL59_11320 [Candidatus Competibacteraceae bacterium]|nr:hypothetical protein [Candidatus Competibacteraceae bacterium]
MWIVPLPNCGVWQKTNLVGTFSLLEAARMAWLDGKTAAIAFHHISSVTGDTRLSSA